MKVTDEEKDAVLKLLAESGFPEGLSQDQLAERAGWTNAKVNDVLCAFPVGYFGHHKVKLRGNVKITKYFLKETTLV